MHRVTNWWLIASIASNFKTSAKCKLHFCRCIKEIEKNDWCIIDLNKNFLYHQNLNTLIEKSSKIQWLIWFLQKYCKNESEQSNWFIIFLICLVVCFVIWLISLLISTSYLQTLALLFIMHIITFSLAKRLILQQWLLKIERKVEWMHSQLSTDDHQKLVNIFQKENKDEKKSFKIIVEEFQVMSVNYMMHRARYVVIMKSQFTMNVKNQIKKWVHWIDINQKIFCYQLICLDHSVEKKIVCKANIRAQFIIMIADVRKNERLTASNTELTTYLEV